MRHDDIPQLVTHLRAIGTDTADVEVKAARQKLPKSLSETVSAFANHKGGTILLGLSEEDNFALAPGFKAQPISDALAQMCSDDLHPAARAEIAIEPFEGGSVVHAWIPPLDPAERPCYIKARGKYQGSYIRTGDGDRKLTAYEIDRFEENRTNPTWDQEIVDKATLDDLDSRLVQGLLDKERTQSPRIFANKDDKEALRSLGAIGKAEDGEWRPLLGGLLALGSYPQEFFPRLTVSFTAYPGSDRTSSPTGQRFLDSATLSGPIPYLIEAAIAHVSKNMRTGGVIRGAFRTDLHDYPPVAVREAVTNALMHRDYSPQARGSQVQIDMYADRLEITNPGGLYGPVTVQELTDGTAISSSRNVRLSRLLESIPFPGGGYVAENRGSGFQEIERQLRDDHLPPPRAVDTPSRFSLTFTQRPQPEADKASTSTSTNPIVDHLRTHRLASSRDLAAATGMSLSGVRKALNPLIKAGIVERTEPTKSPKQRYRLT